MYTKLGGQYSDGIVIFSETESSPRRGVCCTGTDKACGSFEQKVIKPSGKSPLSIFISSDVTVLPLCLRRCLSKKKTNSMHGDRSISLATGRALLRSLALSRISAGHLGMIPLKR